MKIITIRPNGTKQVKTVIEDELKTDQSFKEECDVNNIINKYMKTGDSSIFNRTTGTYGDFSEITDLKESMELVKYAEEQFMQIPAELRKKFGNDPTQLTEYLQDPKNHEEAQHYGLLTIHQKKNDDQTTKTNDESKNTP